MTTEKAASRGVIVAAVILTVLIFLIWALQLSFLADLTGSDPAGNALGQGFTALTIILLWTLLAILALLAGINGFMPWPAALAALILIPASGFVAEEALDLLTSPDVAPFMWPIALPALAPPLVVVFCFWALLPALRKAVPMRAASGILCGILLILCLSILPLLHLRQVALDKQAAARADVAAAFARIAADAPLWDWTPFLGTVKEEEALARIRQLPRRQSDAEAMLDRGDFPLGYLARFDLHPTPSLCDKSRKLLRQRVAPLVLKSANSKPYADIAEQVEGALSAMSWLIDYGCDCGAESLAWEAMAKAYRDTNFDVYSLAELREPKNLGRALRDDPVHKP